ncbi:hypothetical protein L208DRAFT_1380767 [Tricholoma matsutake]|nr:hypothetical protein L208DRAFT_1380767 [Tricholoma matsutake 945]
MDNSRTSDRHKLQEISRIAQRMQSFSAPDHRKRTNDLLVSFPPQLIPSTTTILPQLEETGLPHGLAEEISSTYLKACDELRSICELSLRKAVASLEGSVTTETVHSMVRIWSTAHSQRTSTWSESAVSRARALVAKTQSRDTSEAKKASFNYEYTPLLEKYFEYNAYPSAPDRAVLARKSMMTPRQIEVWFQFQNHRNRAKKEGRTLRRLSSDPLPLELSLQSLEQKMPFFTVPESERKMVIESDASESEASDEVDKAINQKSIPNANTTDLAMTAPSHAFPTTYPPSCHYVPFPCKNGKSTFPAPVWSRKPATSLQARAIGDFDDFVADFSAKLVLREVPSKNGGRGNHVPSAKTLRPWFTATHTFAPPAPHPAFIRSYSAHVTSSRSSPIPAISAPSSRLHPFRSPSPYSLPTSLIPPTQSTPAVRRKVARLSKRSPNRQSMAHRGVSPATSEASLSPSSRSCSSTSRVSSFGSDSPTKRRPSSSSSSSSPSSTLTTPELSPAMLPEHTQSPVAVAGIDFQDLESLFGDPLNNVSPDAGLQLNFPAEDSLNVPAFTEKQPLSLRL